jgi:ribosomal protein L17
MEECKSIAESLIPQFKENIKNNQKILWSEIMDVVDHDELIYKLSLKYLRRDGYDIGNYKIPEVKAFISQN